MAMTKKCTKTDHIILNILEELVPQDHEVRKLEECIDWQFIYPLVEDLYSSSRRPSIDPVVLFKMLFINFIFGINSMRKTCREIQVNIAYRWFLGLTIDDPVPTIQHGVKIIYEDALLIEINEDRKNMVKSPIRDIHRKN